MFKYLSTTWIIALLVHPISLICWLQMRTGEPLSFAAGHLEIMLWLFLFTLLFFLPAFFICYCVLRMLSRIETSAETKFFYWLFVAPAVVMGYYAGFIMAIDRTFWEPDSLEVALPAIITAFIVIIARMNQFMGIIRQINHPAHKTVAGN